MSKGTRNAPARWLDSIPWSLLILGSLTLGLAPFVPQPHLVEKLGMLVRGDLVRPIDIFDLVLHGAFPLLLVLKTTLRLGSSAGSSRGEG